MNIMVLGAAGFIGTNLTAGLKKNSTDSITLVDSRMDFFEPTKKMGFNNISYIESEFNASIDFEELTYGQDYIYHLVSTSIPTNSNQRIQHELTENVISTTKLVEACVKNNIKRLTFISSGGTVYGKEGVYPLSENAETNPINSYGLQKLTIEKMLYLYQLMYGFDYRVVRLSNPYGPHQRPNGILGVVTTFVYKALNGQKITVYGDGSVVRDFIYVDDAIRAIINVANSESDNKRIFNVGCGYGTSVNQVIETIKNTLKKELDIEYIASRPVDVPINYLDISRYEQTFGTLNPITLADGVIKTAHFFNTAL